MFLIIARNVTPIFQTLRLNIAAVAGLTYVTLKMKSQESNMTTAEKAKEYGKKYYMEHREKILAQIKANNLKNNYYKENKGRKKTKYVVFHNYYNLVVEDTNINRLCRLLRVSNQTFKKALENGAEVHDWTIDVR